MIHTGSSVEHKAVDDDPCMMIHRKNEVGETEIFNGGYYSSVLDKHRKNWEKYIKLTPSHVYSVR